MAVREGFSSADPYTGSLLDRVRITSSETFMRRFLLWATVAACGFVVGRVLIHNGAAGPDPLLVTSMRVLGVCAGFGAALYCFTRFVLGRELSFLWSSAAFNALAVSASLQIAADIRAPHSTVHGIITSSAWLAASFFFLGSAHSKAVWRVTNRKQGLGLLIAGFVLVGVFPAVSLPYALDSALLILMSTVYGSVSIFQIFDFVARFMAPIVVAAALIGFQRRMSRSNDRLSGIMCFFLLTCLFGLLARAISTTRFDDWWTLSQIIISAAWIVLVAGVEIENAFAHREASDRLHELETLHHVSWSMVGAGTSSEMMNTFVSTLVDGLGVKVAAVYLVDGSGECLELAAINGLEDASPSVGTKYKAVSEERRPGFHSGHTSKALKSNEVQVAYDVFVDVEFVPWKVIAVDDGCAASLPLVSHGKSIGVLNVYFANHRQFTKQRLKLLAIIAAAASPAIENSFSRECVDDSENISLAA